MARLTDGSHTATRGAEAVAVQARAAPEGRVKCAVGEIAQQGVQAAVVVHPDSKQQGQRAERIRDDPQHLLHRHVCDRSHAGLRA